MGLQNQLEPCTDISISEITENRIHYSNECRNKIFKEAEDNIKQAQEKQKTNYDKRHNIIRHTFKIHDKILLQNLQRKTKKGHKEEEKWLGPYTITKINASGIFTMISSTGKQIKRHGSQLKPYISADGFETHESSPPLHTAQTVPSFSQGPTPDTHKNCQAQTVNTAPDVSSFSQGLTPEIHENYSRSSQLTVSSCLQGSAKHILNEIANDAGHHVIMGDMHQGEHPLTDDLAAGSQCSSMSYTSILYASSTNICSWSTDDINHVKIQGHIIHTNQLNFLHRNVPDLDHRLAIDELPKRANHLHRQYSCFLSG